MYSEKERTDYCVKKRMKKCIKKRINKRVLTRCVDLTGGQSRVELMERCMENTMNFGIVNTA